LPKVIESIWVLYAVRVATVLLDILPLRKMKSILSAHYKVTRGNLVGVPHTIHHHARFVMDSPTYRPTEDIQRVVDVRITPAMPCPSPSGIELDLSSIRYFRKGKNRTLYTMANVPGVKLNHG
jgi:hypothetical protein